MLLEEQRTGRTWRLQTKRVYRLGRNPDQDIRLDEPTVSRAHAELFWDGQTWQVRDCGSRFGTYLGDRSIKQEVLPPQKWFRLGNEPGILLRLKPAESSDPLQKHSTGVVDNDEVFYPPEPPQAPFNLGHFHGHPEVKQDLKAYADLILDANLNHPVQGILLLGGRGPWQAVSMSLSCRSA